MTDPFFEAYAVYPANIQGVVFRNDQEGFLGGTVAGLFANVGTKKVGMISGLPFQALTDINGGAKVTVALFSGCCYFSETSS